MANCLQLCSWLLRLILRGNNAENSSNQMIAGNFRILIYAWEPWASRSDLTLPWVTCDHGNGLYWLSSVHQSTNKGLNSMTESIRARRCERHTTPDVGHRMDDDQTELRLKSCILGRPFDTWLVHGESTGSRDRMPYGEMSPTRYIRWAIDGALRAEL